MYAAIFAVLTSVVSAAGSDIRPAVFVTTTNSYTDPASLACATLAVYGEARGESLFGRAVVATTILNRSRKFHQSVCSVVFDRKQFSGINHLVFPKAAMDQEALKECEDIAVLILSENYAVPPPFSSATHFRVVTVSHNWLGLMYLGSVGNHQFFKD